MSLPHFQHDKEDYCQSANHFDFSLNTFRTNKQVSLFTHSSSSLADRVLVVQPAVTVILT